MIKEVSIQGVTAIPSDYDCADGTLDQAINLVPENGALRPVLPPKTLFYIPPRYTMLAVHKVAGIDMLLFYAADNNGKIYYGNKKDLETNFAANIKEIDIFISGDENVYDCAIIGNTVCLATESGLQYLLYRDGTYVYLGAKPPFIALEFGMIKEPRHGAYQEKDIVIHKDMSPEKPTAATFGMESELASLTQQLYGMLLPYVNDNITAKGYFYQPFFVRYAYRLYDGSHYWPSAPILMLPTATIPLLKIGAVSSGDDANHVKVKTTMLVDKYSLMCRPCGVTSDGGSLSAWSDIVSGIDIFVSAPIYTYMQSKDLTNPWLNAKSLMSRAPFAKTKVITTSTGDTDTQVTTLLGHYAEELTGSCIDRTFVSQDNNAATKYWNLVANEDFGTEIQKACNFYLYKSISISEASTYLYTPAKLPPDDADLSNLVSRQTLADSYQSHHTIVPRSLYAFNSRLNCANMRIQIPQPFPLNSAMERTYVKAEDGHHVNVDYAVTIKVYCRVDSQVYCRTHQGVKRNDNALGMDVLFNPSSTAPRYFYYPDTNAFRAEILCEYDDGTTQGGVRVKHVLPLKAHEYLNGAYFFQALAPGVVPPANSTNVSALTGEVDISNKIYTSEANNPFTFAPVCINTIGNGRILALSAAVKALSQGQFGQFPLYAFASDGIWALHTNTSGSYSAVSPVSRDVCVNAAAITQTDTEVLFPAARGLMVLSGANVKCVSEDIDNKIPYNIPLNTLPGLDILHSELKHDNDDCIAIVPFRDFLAEARILYDHAHQRVFVANATKSYAYVLSLTDSRWGMAHSALDYGVLSYPYSLAVSRIFGHGDNARRAVLDFSRYDNEDSETECMFVTRPMKLDAPDVLKTISEVVLRGYFYKNHVAIALYGSRDLYSWQLIWSATNHRLRGFSGTPYKYFRIAAYGWLYPDESISGISINTYTRYTNRLR